MNKTCVQCGKVFTLSQSEIDFYESKNLNLPKRCKSCRDKNKNSNGEYRSYTANVPLGNRATCISAIFCVATFVTIMSILANGGFTLPTAFLDLIAFFAIFCLAKCKRHIDIQEFDVSCYPRTFFDMDSMTEHYIKHGKETNCKDMEEYLYRANAVIQQKNTLSKKQKEDGDTAFFNSQTKEFVVVAKAGYIRTYFIASLSYYNKQ